MHIRPLYLLVFAIKISVSSSQTCDNVRDLVVHITVPLHLYTQPLSLYNSTVTGCISDATFKPTIVYGIILTCETAKVPKLEKNFIANMERLQSILIYSCSINAIEPGAFFNLPRLLTLEIQGNPLTQITYGIFNVLPSLVALALHNNKISRIEDHAFANLPNLQTFELSKNLLDHLNPEWFTNTSNIKAFFANQNLIGRIPSGMFRGWKKLVELNLIANDISEIEDGSFNDSAPAMEFLSLHQNRLTSVSPKIFSSSLFIRKLLISGNLLNYLSEDFLKNIYVKNLYIFGNPFTCPCLKRIDKILEKRDVYVDEYEDLTPILRNVFSLCKNKAPACGYSAKFPDSCVDVVDKEVTRQVITAMKKAGLERRRNEYDYQCAMFNYD